jgi:hypothetical protein
MFRMYFYFRLSVQMDEMEDFFATICFLITAVLNHYSAEVEKMCLQRLKVLQSGEVQKCVRIRFKIH